MTILRAIISKVPVGPLVFDGLMDEAGAFYVGVPQLCSVFGFPIKHSSRDIKALLGKDSGFPVKLKTSLGTTTTAEGKASGNKAPINAILLRDFEKLIRILDRKGNPAAAEFVDAMLGLSLHQLFCDAFEVECNSRDRQKFLAERLHHREHFHKHLTKWLKEDAGGDSDTVNWGKEVNIFKNACKLPLTCVDTWDGKHLQVLNHAETSYNSLRLAGLPHEKALSVLKLQH